MREFFQKLRENNIYGAMKVILVWRGKYDRRWYDLWDKSYKRKARVRATKAS